MKKVIFLDRDGTLIEDKIYLNDPEQIYYLDNVFDALREFRDQGFEFVVITNQSGIARGIVQPKNLSEIHKRIQNRFSEVGVNFLAFYYAPYLPVTDHYLRKPHPGMIMEAVQHFDIDLKMSWMIGDRMTDVEAGHRAGTRTILLGDLEDPKLSQFSPPEIHCHCLHKAALKVLQIGDSDVAG